ncbi:MAG: hypothetical protein AB7T10_02435 [bacterium]
MNRKHLFFMLIVAAIILLVYGFLNKDLQMIFNFGRFICFDCIGIS